MNQNSKMKTMIVSTDPMNEIDDEIFIHWCLHNVSYYNVWIMCVPGCETIDPNEKYNVSLKRLNHMLSLFPMFKKNVNEYTYSSQTSTFTLCTLKWFEETEPMFVDYYVDIAPSWHISPELFKNITIHTRIIMGDIENPESSLNLTKAIPKTVEGKKILEEFYSQERELYKSTYHIISIPTHFARQIPIPYLHMEKLPIELREPLENKSFEQFITRPHPKYVWSYDVSNANYRTILNMFNEPHYYINKINSGYTTNDLENKLDIFLEDSPPMSVKNLLEYKDRLRKIALMVTYITKFDYEDHHFNCGSFTNIEFARQNWYNWVHSHKCDGTPAYDLIAAVAIVKPDCLENVDKCKELIKTL